MPPPVAWRLKPTAAAAAARSGIWSHPSFIWPRSRLSFLSAYETPAWPGVIRGIVIATPNMLGQCVPQRRASPSTTTDLARSASYAMAVSKISREYNCIDYAPRSPLCPLNFLSLHASSTVPPSLYLSLRTHIPSPSLSRPDLLCNPPTPFTRPRRANFLIILFLFPLSSLVRLDAATIMGAARRRRGGRTMATSIPPLPPHTLRTLVLY